MHNKFFDKSKYLWNFIINSHNRFIIIILGFLDHKLIDLYFLLKKLNIFEFDILGESGIRICSFAEKAVSLMGGEIKRPTWGIPELDAPKKCKQF